MESDNINHDNFLSLKELIASGDERAFRQLYNLFSEKLIQFAFALVKTKQAAIEIVDKVFIKIWLRRANFIEVENIKVYLYAATKNTALNFLAEKAHQQNIQPFDHLNIELREEECPEKQMINSEIFRKIKRAIDELPPRCKIIFKLVREDGLKYKEVAEILNISTNTIDAQMVIAVKKISEKVKGQFDFLPRFASKKINL